MPTRLSHVRRKKVRKLLLQKQGERCCYCGNVMWNTGQESAPEASRRMKVPRRRLFLRMMTIEHIRDQSKGGSHRIGNLALACYGCNQERADRGMNWLEFATFKQDGLMALREFVK